MGGKKPLRRPLWPPTRATASNYYPLGLDGAGGAAKPLLRAPKKPAPLHGRLPAFSGAVDAFERARKCFLEWRYFFSIILSEFLKNRVALQRTPRHDLFDDGFLKIDFSEQSASLAGESLDFTPKEYRTLFLFVKNPRIILTKRQILEKLWDIDGDFVDEHTLTTIISRIRKKIETDERKYIKTAYGMGYQWIGGEPR